MRKQVQGIGDNCRSAMDELRNRRRRRDWLNRTVRYLTARPLRPWFILPETTPKTSIRASLVHNLVIAISVMLFAGCTSTPKSYYKADPAADFTQYKTYGFYKDLSTDHSDYESMESSLLKVAVAQELEKLGMSYSNAPDIMVNFYIHTKEKIKSRSVPTTSAYHGYETQIDQYTEGTLNIDIVDTKTKKLVCEGLMTGREESFL